ncbi:MAG: hypothetical protein KBT33_11355 [Prevotellaceae bacterium]|nr:hypothetical protein [Candidatus Minthosoma equi]
MFTFAKKYFTMQSQTTKCLSVFFLIFFILTSCDNSSKVSDKINQIKKIGDTNPTLALSMLDSLNVSIPNLSEEEMNRFFLVRLRVQDKADIIPESDLIAKLLLGYYEQKGTEADKQEVYFYAGSVYRDLHDTPRALEYFFRSAELAENYIFLDSVMLRNTYSNLSYLFFGVQDYANAYKYATKEYEMSKALNKTELTCLMHLGMSLSAMDSLDNAKSIYSYTLDTIMSTPHLSKDTEVLSTLLSYFSYFKDITNASKSFYILDQNHVSNEDNGKCLAYGEYYNLIGKRDSAIYYYKLILQNETDLYRMYDASKALFHIFNKSGHIEEANNYANLYIQISDSIDLGNRQELAATVNNEFQYHRDKHKEQDIIDEKERFRFFFIISIVAIVILVLITISFVIYRKNQHLKELLTLSNELSKRINDNKKLHEDIVAKEKELVDSNRLLNQSELDLENVRCQLSKVNEELAMTEEELEKKERILSERMAQNQTFLNLLHQSELEGSAEDVIYAIRQSSGGTKNMTTADWKQLYRAIDDLYPTFKDQLLKELGTFTEQQMQVCYLMRIGLSKTQIQNMTNLSRVTIWRWVKKFAWIQVVDIPTDK